MFFTVTHGDLGAWFCECGHCLIASQLSYRNCLLHCIALLFCAGLDLSHNHLAALPDDLSNLTLLVEFNLSSNLFQLVPSVLLQMASLKKVDLSDNKISDTNKDELCSIPNLETMDLRNNPLNEDIKDQLVTSLVGKITIS